MKIKFQWKRLLSTVLCISLVLSMFPGISLRAEAQKRSDNMEQSLSSQEPCIHSFGEDGLCAYCGEAGTSISAVCDSEDSHIYRAATCAAPATCEVCGATKDEKDPNNHDEAVAYVNGFCPNGCYEPCGTDSSGNYEIGNAGQLYWFAHLVDARNANVNGKLVNDIVVNSNVLAEDGSLNEGDFRPWYPIGTRNNYLAGTFDGQGYTVSGLYFKCPEDVDYFTSGFIGNVVGGTVKNVTLADSYLEGESYAGGVVGGINHGTVENCRNTATVVGVQKAAGIVGCSGSEVTVKNCYNEGKIIATDRDAAGVCILAGSNITVENCYNIGTTQGALNSYGVVDGYYTPINCYYLADAETDSYDGTTAKNADSFASGEVAYLLGEAFGQTIGEEAYPTLGGKKVSFGYTTCDPNQTEPVYTNEEKVFATKPEHSLDPGIANVSYVDPKYHEISCLCGQNRKTEPHSFGEEGTCICGLRAVASVTVKAGGIVGSDGAGMGNSNAGNVTDTAYYETLQQAVHAAAARNGSTVTILQDIDLGDSYVEISSGSFTLDLNGFTVSCKSDYNSALLFCEGEVNVTVIDSGEMGAVDGSFGAIEVRYGATLNIFDGTFRNSDHSVLYAHEGGIINLLGGEVCGNQTDLDCSSNGTIVLGVAEGATEGVTFPGGIKTFGDSVNAMLGEAMAYWQGNTMLRPDAGTTEITGGDVTVKAACTHEGTDKTYADTYTEESHTFTCYACNTSNTESHSYHADSLLCACGKHSPEAVVLTTKDGIPFKAYTDVRSAFTDAEIFTANDKAVLKLLKDLSLGEENIVIWSGYFTFDLNGMHISSTEGSIGAVCIYGNLEIIIRNGSIEGINNAVQVERGKLLLEELTLTGPIGIALKNGEVTLSDCTVQAEYYGLFVEGGVISVYSSSISGDEDVRLYGGTLSLYEGTTFPGGMHLYNTTAYAVLGDGMAYWQGDTMLCPDAGTTEITGGDVIVKAACTHEGTDKTYADTYTEESHTFTCYACSTSATESHSYNADSLLCACGKHSPEAVVLTTKDGIPFKAYTDVWSACEDAGIFTANDKAVLKLLKDLSLGEENIVIWSGYFTFDLNGKHISSAKQSAGAVYIYRYSEIIMRNGSVEGLNNAIHVDGGKQLLEELTLTGPTGIATKDGEVTISDCTVQVEYVGLSVEGGKTSVYSSSISGEYCDVQFIEGTLSLYEGTTFPGGMHLYNTTAHAVLGDGMAYWQGGIVVRPDAGTTEITGGDVTVKAVCTHEGTDKTYTYTEESHTYTCCACTASATESHSYNADSLLCVCGKYSLEAVVLITKDGIPFKAYTDAWSAFTDAETFTANDKAALKLLKDLPLGEEHIVIWSGCFTFDLNGMHISSTASDVGAVCIYGNSEIIIRNGSIEGNNNAVQMGGRKLLLEELTLTGPTGIVLDNGEVTISDCTVQAEHYGLIVEGGVTSVYSSSISGSDDDIEFRKGTLSLYEGTTFPGGMRLENTSGDTALGDGMAYWQGDTMFLPNTEITEITGGDVTVKAACTHEGTDKTYAESYTGESHTYTCYACNFSATESHSFDDNDICNDCGFDRKNTISVTINMTDSANDGWYGNVIAIYTEGTCVATVTLEYGAEDTWTCLMNREKEYEFYWYNGYDAVECGFEILIDGETVLVTEPGECENYPDGYRIYPICEHEYNEHTVPPTCTDAGYTVYSCIHCNYSYEGEQVAPLNHAIGEDGNCARCGELYAAEIWINNIRIDSQNMDDVLGDGTVSYDPYTSTLTFNNAVIGAEEIMRPVVIAQSVNIDIMGENRIVAEQDAIVIANYASVNFGGTGRLVIQAGIGGIFIPSLKSELTFGDCITLEIHAGAGIIYEMGTADLIFKDHATILLGTEEEPCLMGTYPAETGSVSVSLEDHASISCYSIGIFGMLVRDMNVRDSAQLHIMAAQIGLNMNALNITGGSVYVQSSNADYGVCANEVTVTGGKLEVVNGGIIAFYYDSESDVTVPGKIVLGEAMTISEPTGATILLADSYLTIADQNGEPALSFVIEEKEEPLAILSSRSLSLNGNIAINFYMSLADSVVADPNAYMLFTQEGKEPVKVSIADSVKKNVRGRQMHIFTYEVSAKEMTDEIKAQFFYLDTCTEEYSYCVKTYADNQREAQANNQELMNLLDAMLHYGAAAQIYFDYHTERLANEGMQTPDYAAVDLRSFAMSKNQGTALASFAGASLLLNSETTLRFFFKVDPSVEQFTVSYAGQALPVEERNGLIYADITNISAPDLDETFTVTISDGTETAEVSYSALAYCSSVRTNATGKHPQTLLDACAALYLYNQTANQFFEER